jgi:hypothetical protein
MMALQAQQQQQQQQQSQGDDSMGAASPPPPPPPSRELSSMVPPVAPQQQQQQQQQQQDSSAMDVDEPVQQLQQRVQKRQLSPVVPSQFMSSPAARNSSSAGATSAGVTQNLLQSATAASVKAQPKSSVTPAVSKPAAANTSTLSGSGSGTKTTGLTAEQRANAVLKKVFRFTLNKRDPADVYTYVGDTDAAATSDSTTDSTTEQLMNVKNLPELLASRLGMNVSGEGGGFSYLAKAFTRCHEEMQTALRRSEKVSQ